MSINQRISEVIHAFGDSESGFAKRIGVSSSVVFNIVNPKGRMSYPSGVMLEKLLALEKGGKVIAAEWLMRGNGEMFSNQKGFQSAEEALQYLSETIQQLKGEQRK